MGALPGNSKRRRNDSKTAAKAFALAVDLEFTAQPAGDQIESPGHQRQRGSQCSD